MEHWLTWLLIAWAVILPTLFGIGGFFMFRKFLKSMPKKDGKSDLDWENYYIEKTKHLWNKEQLELLEELVKPVPELFRDTARNKIAGKIGEIALQEKARQMTLDIIIRGYIIATPKRDHKYLRKKLAQMKIDVTPYEHLFDV